MKTVTNTGRGAQQSHPDEVSGNEQKTTLPKQANGDFHAILGDRGRTGLLPLSQRLKGIHKGVNPYVTGPALPGNSPVYYGRDQALHETLSVLRRADKPGCVSVVAERRMGKSSLIEQVRRALAAEPGLVTVHASAQDWGGFDQRRFFSGLHRAIAHAIAEPVAGPEQDPADASTDEPQIEDYTGLRDYIEDLASNRRLRCVLLLDEFETLADNQAFDQGFFTHLRALANAPAYRFGILIASRRSLAELRRIHSIEGSAFWNLFGFKHVLGLLQQDEAHGLLQEPMRLLL